MNLFDGRVMRARLTQRLPISRYALSCAVLLGCLTGCSQMDEGAVSAANNGSAKSHEVKSQLEQAQSLVTGSSHGQAKAVKVFSAADQMVGIVVEMNNGSKQVVYGSPGLKTLYPSGVDDQGGNMNEKAVEEQHLYASAGEMLEKAKGRGFVVGSKGPIVTAFMDPNCVFCNKFYTEIMPSVRAGKLRVRFLMSGFLKPTSVPRSIAILSAKDPAKALDQDETHFDKAHEEGGMEPAKSGNPTLEAEISGNNALMGTGGPIATPAILACQKDHGAIYLRGSPSNIQVFVDGLDEKPTIAACSAL